MNIGIIGCGIVGGTMRDAFLNGMGNSVLCYDKDVTRSNCSLEEVFTQDIVFICLPAPVNRDGDCDLSAINEVLEKAFKTDALLVLRSTVPPGTTDHLVASYPDLSICYCPEFLRAAFAARDFRRPELLAVGGHTTQVVKVANCLALVSNPRFVAAMTRTQAEILKLFLNGLAAIKTVYASEVAYLAGRMGADWQKIANTAQLDMRAGIGYLDALGPDGKSGFGGACLPKDAIMLGRAIRDMGLGHPLIDDAVDTSQALRQERW